MTSGSRCPNQQRLQIRIPYITTKRIPAETDKGTLEEEQEKTEENFSATQAELAGEKMEPITRLGGRAAAHHFPILERSNVRKGRRETGNGG